MPKPKIFQNILAATDLVGTSDSPVLGAIQIAKHNGAGLHIIHVLESVYSGKDRRFVKHFKTGEEIVCNTVYEQTVREQIFGTYAAALKTLIHFEIIVTPGFPWEEILRWTRKERVDLVVLGPHTRRAEEKGVVRTYLTVGSTVQGVISHERCPVMIVNQMIPEEKLQFNKIVASTDFSQPCEYACRFAMRLAQRLESKLFLFHIVPKADLGKDSLSEYQTEVTQKLKELCRNASAGIECEFGVHQGDSIYLGLLKYAAEKDADLIIMGSHTKEKDGRWYLGSAVESTSMRSPIPVVVVTNPRALKKIGSISS